MKTSSAHILFIALLFLVVSSVSLVEAKAGPEGGHQHHHHHDHEGGDQTGSIDVDKLHQETEFDIVYGSEDAPLTMVEYASLSCSHCRTFYQDVFEKIKEPYIDTGKVRLIYRHYPLNMPAFRATMLVECVEDPKRQKMFLAALFKSQSEWAYMGGEEAVMSKLKKVAKIGGLDTQSFNDCVADKELEERILAEQVEAGKAFKIQSTPTIFVNGERVARKKDLDTMLETLEKHL